MAKFTSPAKQAASVMKSLQGKHIQSVSTVRNYEQALTRAGEWVKAEKISNGLRSLSIEQAHHYLEARQEQGVSQSTLNMERQALQAMMTHVTGQLEPGQTLTVIKALEPTTTTSRSYTNEQVGLVADCQSERAALATQIAYAAGLRAHELLTLNRADERPMDQRPALPSKFQGREGVRYTVEGKGGLIREVQIPHALAQQLETRRLAAPVTLTDRGVHYTTHYDIAGGKNWSSSFSAASQRALGWSTGAHGVRHSYAQERLAELQQQGLLREDALLTVSQELGHFRASITEKFYLQ